MPKASLEFYIISTEIAQLFQTHTHTRMVENRIKYFCFVIHYPANTTHSNTHTLTPFSEFLTILSRVASLIPLHAQLILLTYPLTHTHPRPSVSAKTCVSSKIGHRAPPPSLLLLLRSSSSSQSS